MITLDTSGLFALLNRADPDHAGAVATIDGERPPFVVPAGILAEICYLIETRLGHGVLDSFLGDLEDGAFTLDCGENDLGRIRFLADRYRDLPLGFADASVVACAERSGGAVLTLDRRDFGVVAKEGTITVRPE
ncbi:MAG: type II toxin-antitoxin system VapC family toxin [Acidimicrobiales bacterium]